jgi:hypothetical protein
MLAKSIPEVHVFATHACSSHLSPSGSSPLEDEVAELPTLNRSGVLSVRMQLDLLQVLSQRADGMVAEGDTAGALRHDKVSSTVLMTSTLAKCLLWNI